MSDKLPVQDDGIHYERGSLVCSRRVLDKLGHMVSCLKDALAADTYIEFLLRKGPGYIAQEKIDEVIAKRNALMRETEY